MNEALAAQAILEIANLPTRLGVRQDRAQVAKLLHEVHIEEELKRWGFGKVGWTKAEVDNHS